MQEKFKIRITQMSFSSELHICECEQPKQIANECGHDFLHEIITHYKNNQVNACLRGNTRKKRGETCCLFDQKPSIAKLNNLEQSPPFTQRSKQKPIEDISSYICYLLDGDGIPYDKVVIVTNDQIQRLPSSLMNSLYAKEDVELFQMHNIEEIYVQDDVNNDHINVKEIQQNSFVNMKSGSSKLF